MIRLLLSLHPRAWRERYGGEFRAMLEQRPLTASVVFDVARNAARQHVRARTAALRIVVAASVSLVVEVLAVRSGLTDNILWPPSTVLRGVALAALVLPWLPVATTLARRPLNS